MSIKGSILECSLCSFSRYIYFLSSFFNSIINIILSIQGLFWQQQNYYGVDLTPLHGTAYQGYFSQVSYQLGFRKLSEVF
jgi:hypothetical protein